MTTASAILFVFGTILFLAACLSIAGDGWGIAIILLICSMSSCKQAEASDMVNIPQYRQTASMNSSESISLLKCTESERSEFLSRDARTQCRSSEIMESAAISRHLFETGKALL